MLPAAPMLLLARVTAIRHTRTAMAQELDHCVAFALDASRGQCHLLPEQRLVVETQIFGTCRNVLAMEIPLELGVKGLRTIT